MKKFFQRYREHWISELPVMILLWIEIIVIVIGIYFLIRNFF